MSNACLSCGACCAFYRVSFYWAEAEPFLGGKTPKEFTVKLTPHLLAMKGTQHKPTRCVALLGMVGQPVSCGIYINRPTPCQELTPSWHDGNANPQCDKARLAHGLPPLHPPQFEGPQQPLPPLKHFA